MQERGGLLNGERWVIMLFMSSGGSDETIFFCVGVGTSCRFDKMVSVRCGILTGSASNIFTNVSKTTADV